MWKGSGRNNSPTWKTCANPMVATVKIIPFGTPEQAVKDLRREPQAHRLRLQPAVQGQQAADKDRPVVEAADSADSVRRVLARSLASTWFG